MIDDSIKVAILEQKVTDFGNVVSKIDDAISKISDVNANITKMLAVHEERIEQCNKADNLITKLIDDSKAENLKVHNLLNDRIDTITDEINAIKKEVSEVSKIKWMTIGCGVLLAVLTTAFSTFTSGWWTPSEMQLQRQEHLYRGLNPESK